MADTTEQAREFERMLTDILAEKGAMAAKLAQAREALLSCARQAEALKLDCDADPESSQAIRNGRYQAISTTAHIALGTITGPAALAQEPAPAATANAPLQAGMSNDELRAAWAKKLPGVEPTERDLTAFALGAEVGREIGLKDAAQAAQPDDSYQDEWFKAKADAVRRICALMTAAPPASAPAEPVARMHPDGERVMTERQYAEAARQGGASWVASKDYTTKLYTAAAIAAARREERERCAMRADLHSQYPITNDFDRGYDKGRKDAAAALRSLGDE